MGILIKAGVDDHGLRSRKSIAPTSTSNGHTATATTYNKHPVTDALQQQLRTMMSAMQGRLSCNARSSSPSFYLHSPRTPSRKNIAAMAVAILLAHTMATTRGATIITADGPTTRAHAMARSGVTLVRSGVKRGVEDGRSVSIDRDDKKLKVYLEYTKMRALAFITRRYP